MKIHYENFSSVSRITLRAVLPELRLFNRCIDAAQRSENVAITRTGYFFIKATITGKSIYVLRVYKALCREIKK